MLRLSSTSSNEHTNGFFYSARMQITHLHASVFVCLKLLQVARQKISDNPRRSTATSSHMMSTLCGASLVEFRRSLLLKKRNKLAHALVGVNIGLSCPREHHMTVM